MLVIFDNFFFVYELYLVDILITDFQTRHESLSLRFFFFFFSFLRNKISFFIRLLSFKHIHHNHIHVVSDKAGDPASSNELFKRSPQY